MASIVPKGKSAWNMLGGGRYLQRMNKRGQDCSSFVDKFGRRKLKTPIAFSIGVLSFKHLGIYLGCLGRCCCTIAMQTRI